MFHCLGLLFVPGVSGEGERGVISYFRWRRKRRWEKEWKKERQRLSHASCIRARKGEGWREREKRPPREKEHEEEEEDSLRGLITRTRVGLGRQEKLFPKFSRKTCSKNVRFSQALLRFPAMERFAKCHKKAGSI